MKKKCFLPLAESKMTSYLFHAFPDAIIRGNVGDDGMPPIACRRNINCFYQKQARAHKFMISVSDNWSADLKVLQYQTLNLYQSTYDVLNRNMALTIKRFVESGCYIYGQCNRRCVDAAVGKDSPALVFLLYGYDDTCRRFFLLGYDLQNRCRSYEVGYTELVSALFDLPREMIQLIFWRFNADLKIPLDLPGIINELADYLASCNSRPEYTGGKEFGLAAIRALRDYFKSRVQQDLLFEEQYLRAFGEHKYAMAVRIKYFAEQGIVSTELIPIADKLKQIGENVFQWGTQYNQTLEDSLADKLIEQIEESMRIEQACLPRVLVALRTYQEENV